MIPTVPWMRQKFAEFNAKYFGGELPIPQFAVQTLEDEWGKYTLGTNYDKRTRRVINPNGLTGKIILTNAYSRNEKSVAATLIHEMAHEYVYLIMGVYPKNIHGREFMTAAKNAIADGWVVEEETAESADDIYGGKDDYQGSVLCVIKKNGGQDYQWWVCRCERETMQEFRATASKIPGATISFYEISAPSLMHVQSNASTLFGWGGMSYAEAVKKMANYCGTTPSEFDGKKMRLIK